MPQVSLQLRKNHRFLTYTPAIKQICNPLQLMQIQMFTYRKRFSDNSEVYLSTHANWIDDYFRLGLYESSIFEGDIRHYPTGFLLWPKECELDVFRHGQIYYNSISGITFCNNNDDSCELFFFSSSDRLHYLSDYYLYNLDLLQNFVSYFKEMASEIIKDCSAHPLKLPPFTRHTAVQLYLDQISQNTSPPQREAFNNAIKYNKKVTLKSELATLTQREYDCLNLLVRAHSTVKIAKMMGISHRTVEAHLMHIREKLQCRNKTELLLKVHELMTD